MPATALDQVRVAHDVRAIIQPRRGGRLRALARSAATLIGARPPDPPDAFAQLARNLSIPILDCRGGRDRELHDRLSALDLDVIVIASFPFLLAPPLYDVARHGAINMHTSLLPRHRGPQPFFWVYHADDRETGVTVHRVSERADQGEVLGQTRFDLPRGYPIPELFYRSSDEGARLIVDALARIEAGEIRASAQDEAAATWAPRLQPGATMVDFANWPAERVWHFLGGLCARYREPLTDAEGRAVGYTGVDGFTTESHGCQAGTVQRRPGGWNLFCRDGLVQLTDPRR